MEPIIQKVFFSILIIPLIGIVVYSIAKIEKSFQFGRRWQFKNDDIEPNENLIKMNKILLIVVLIVIIRFYILFIFS